MQKLNFIQNIEAQLGTMKYPTRQLETWKYTSTQSIQEKQFVAYDWSQEIQLTESEVQLLNSYKIDGFNHLVILNGKLSESYSDFSSKDKSALKLMIQDLNDSDYAALLQESQTAQHIFQFQNYLNAQYKKVVVPSNTILDQPIQILQMTTQNAEAKSTHSYLKFEVGDFSKLTVVQTYIGNDKHTYLQNNHTEFRVKKSATLELTRSEFDSEKAFHLGRTYVYLDTQSHLEALSVTLKAQFSRHEFQVHFCGEHSTARVYGLYLTSKNQHADHQTWINHQVGHCDSDQLYKGILADNSRAVFDGLVYIHPQAQKANSAQLNNNLLLSSKAEIDTKPQLEIYADDVKASHGSTVGQLNPEEIFYFMSRAISHKDALYMLSLGYASEVVYKITNIEVQNWLLPKILNHLKENHFSEAL